MMTGPVWPYPRDPGGHIIRQHIIPIAAPAGAQIEEDGLAGRVMPVAYAAVDGRCMTKW